MTAAAPRTSPDTSTASSDASSTPPDASRVRYFAVMALLLAGAAIVAFVARTMRPKPPMPVLVAMPSFSLVDQAGKPFGDRDLAAKPFVADFIFTHCQSSCPRLTASMRKLDTMLPADVRERVRLVSFSVDPEHDTPAVLSAYAAEAHADTTHWSFLTGPSDAVQKTVVDGFKMTAQRTEKGAGDYDVLHGNWFVVGDRSGVRGYFPTEDDDELHAVADAVTRLVHEGAASK